MNLGNTFKSAATAIAVCMLGLASSANAATATTTFQVTATVQAACTISATALAFGNYSGAQSDNTSTITVTCTNSTPYRVGLDAGASTGATVTTRKMTGPGGATLGYALFQDGARTINWGNTPGTDTPASVNGNGSGQTTTVYGRIAGAQYPTPGSYSDTITATVNY